MKLKCVICIEMCATDCDQTTLTIQAGSLYCRRHLLEVNDHYTDITPCMTPRSIEKREEREDAIRTTAD